MNKLRLELDTLVVESFDTRADAGRGDGGTVFGQATVVGNPADTCSRCYYTWPECATPWPACDSMYQPCETVELAACDTTGCDTQDLAACSPIDTAETC